MPIYKKQYDFNFPEGAVCFLANIEKMVKKYEIETKPNSFKLDFKFKVFSYPYCHDLLSIIKRTYEYRYIDINLKKYEVEHKENKDIYIYTFEIRNKKLK